MTSVKRVIGTSSSSLKSRIPPDLACFVISMRRSHERRLHIATQFKRLGIPFEFIEAVDGNSLDDHETRRIAGAGFSEQLGIRMPKAWIGCTLSHRAALQTIVDRGIPNGLIFEDDAQLVDDFSERVREALAAPVNWHMLKLSGGIGPGTWGQVLAQTGGGKIVQLPIPSYLMTAYVVSNAGARKLLPFLFPVTDIIDLTLQKVWITGLDVAELIPYPVRPVGAPSTIEKPEEPAKSLRRTLRRIPYRIMRSVGRRLYLIQRFGLPPRASYAYRVEDEFAG